LAQTAGPEVGAPSAAYAIVCRCVPVRTRKGDRGSTRVYVQGEGSLGERYHFTLEKLDPGTRMLDCFDQASNPSTRAEPRSSEVLLPAPNGPSQQTSPGKRHREPESFYGRCKTVRTQVLKHAPCRRIERCARGAAQTRRETSQPARKPASASQPASKNTREPGPRAPLSGHRSGEPCTEHAPLAGCSSRFVPRRRNGIGRWFK